MAMPAYALVFGLAILALSGCSVLGLEGEATERITIRNHHFERPTLTVPAGVPFTLIIEADHDTPLKFRSPALGIEMATVPGNYGSEATRVNSLPPVLRSVRIELGPLTPGRYEFFCDCHDAIIPGAIVAK